MKRSNTPPIVANAQPAAARDDYDGNPRAGGSASRLRSGRTGGLIARDAEVLLHYTQGAIELPLGAVKRRSEGKNPARRDLVAETLTKSQLESLLRSGGFATGCASELASELGK